MPTIAEIDREIAELESVTEADLNWSVASISKAGDIRPQSVELIRREDALRLMRLGVAARIAQLEQQRADLGLKRSEGPTGNKTIENAAKARECYREALRQVAKRESLTPAELAPAVSGVSGANDYDEALHRMNFGTACSGSKSCICSLCQSYTIPTRLDHNQP